MGVVPRTRYESLGAEFAGMLMFAALVFHLLLGVRLRILGVMQHGHALGLWHVEAHIHQDVTCGGECAGCSRGRCRCFVDKADVVRKSAVRRTGLILMPVSSIWSSSRQYASTSMKSSGDKFWSCSSTP